MSELNPEAEVQVSGDGVAERPDFPKMDAGELRKLEEAEGE